MVENYFRRFNARNIPTALLAWIFGLYYHYYSV